MAMAQRVAKRGRQRASARCGRQQRRATTSRRRRWPGVAGLPVGDGQVGGLEVGADRGAGEGGGEDGVLPLLLPGPGGEGRAIGFYCDDHAGRQERGELGFGQAAGGAGVEEEGVEGSPGGGVAFEEGGGVEEDGNQPRGGAEDLLRGGFVGVVQATRRVVSARGRARGIGRMRGGLLARGDFLRDARVGHEQGNIASTRPGGRGVSCGRRSGRSRS